MEVVSTANAEHYPWGNASDVAFLVVSVPKSHGDRVLVDTASNSRDKNS